MKISLFGASGFIGSNLARRLSQDGQHEVRLFDLDDRKLRLRFENSDYAFEKLDISHELDRIDAVVADSDLVIDLAAYVHPAMFMQNPLDVVQLNLFDCLNVIRACVRHDTRLIHFSTSEVYGKANNSDAPFREDHSDLVLGPVAKQRWIYSCAKQLLDRMIHAHGEQDGLRYTLVRPFNFVGPMIDKFSKEWRFDDNPRVFANFMSSLVYRRPLQLVDGGQARRCFTDIEDAVSALLAIVDHPDEINRQIVNVGNPRNETTIRGLAERMASRYAALNLGAGAPQIVDVLSARFYGDGYEDCDRRLPDISKMQSIGWSPKHDLDATINRSMAYFLSNQTRLVEALGD